MEKPDGIITETDTVYDVVTKYPQLKAVLAEISPKFTRLGNPVLFNTVAKVTTLETASKIGGIYLKEMVYRLNEAIGKSADYMAWFKSQIPKMQEDFLKKQFAAAAETAGEKPAWLERARAFETLDARVMDGEPFPVVAAKAAPLKAGEGFILVQKFRPAPLINYLATQGFDSWTEKAAEDEFRVYFMKK